MLRILHVILDRLGHIVPGIAHRLTIENQARLAEACIDQRARHLLVDLVPAWRQWRDERPGAYLVPSWVRTVGALRILEAYGWRATQRVREQVCAASRVDVNEERNVSESPALEIVVRLLALLKFLARGVEPLLQLAHLGVELDGLLSEHVGRRAVIAWRLHLHGRRPAAFAQSLPDALIFRRRLINPPRLADLRDELQRLEGKGVCDESGLVVGALWRDALAQKCDLLEHTQPHVGVRLQLGQRPYGRSHLRLYRRRARVGRRHRLVVGARLHLLRHGLRLFGLGLLRLRVLSFRVRKYNYLLLLSLRYLNLRRRGLSLLRRCHRRLLEPLGLLPLLKALLGVGQGGLLFPGTIRLGPTPPLYAVHPLLAHQLLRGDTLHLVFLVAHVAVVTLAGMLLLEATPSKLAPAEPNAFATTVDHGCRDRKGYLGW
eukprot:scaffold70823_cov54-Phaeocystis_antarctica.AAC.3